MCLCFFFVSVPSCMCVHTGQREHKGRSARARVLDKTQVNYPVPLGMTFAPRIRITMMEGLPELEAWTHHNKMCLFLLCFCPFWAQGSHWLTGTPRWKWPGSNPGQNITKCDQVFYVSLFLALLPAHNIAVRVYVAFLCFCPGIRIRALQNKT